VLRAKLGARISLPFCLLGSYAPDMATKWLVYGVSLGGDRLRIGDPMQFHCGWPGVGFTHSYSFGALVSMLIFAVSKNRVFAFSFLIGQWLHTTSDMLDSVGVMALFPFSTMQRLDRHITPASLEDSTTPMRTTPASAASATSRSSSC
jgi:membrane-bound metal-dependent hydrolase YbcI (DUF457 family)